MTAPATASCRSLACRSRAWAAVVLQAAACLASPAARGSSAAAAEAVPPASVAEATRIAADLAAARDATPSLAAKADRAAILAPEMLVPCLMQFADATPAGANWLRSGLDRAVARLEAATPLDELEAFVRDPGRPGRARWLAFGWLRERDAARAGRLLDRLGDDPVPELRREAVEKLLASADGADDAAQRDIHRRGLTAARDVDQVERIAEWFSAHGEPVDVGAVLGFLRHWRVSEAFDNAGGRGFATAYPPEAAGTAADAAAWKPVQTQDKHGAVDLNAAIAMKKGVLSYAVAEVEMPRALRGQVRIGSPCAVAVWVNGTPVMAHEIYHASEAVDQYVGEAGFRAGVNTVMVKCCQNEQTEPWAADWKFQLRICDPLGVPLGRCVPPAVPPATSSAGDAPAATAEPGPEEKR